MGVYSGSNREPPPDLDEPKKQTRCMRLLRKGAKAHSGSRSAKDSVLRSHARWIAYVPACEECNQSFRADDEYTGTVIALDIRAATHRDVIGNIASIARSLQNPGAAASRNIWPAKLSRVCPGR